MREGMAQLEYVMLETGSFRNSSKLKFRRTVTQAGTKKRNVKRTVHWESFHPYMLCTMPN